MLLTLMIVTGVIVALFGFYISRRIANPVIELNEIDFIASDNFFPMKPNETRKIVINLKSIEKDNRKLNFEKIEKSIKVKSLYDLFN